MKRSYIIATAIAALLVAWLYSGRFDWPMGGDAGTQETAAAGPARHERPLTSVRVVELEAEPVRQEIVVNGRTAPARKVHIKAETVGRIVDIHAERGMSVHAGDVIVRVDTRERDAMIRRYEAYVAQRQIEYDAARKLGEKGFQAETKVAESLANLQAAEADLERMEVELDHTAIVAPFDGVLDRRPVEIGDFVDVGDHVATVIEQDPYLVIGDVAELEAAGLRVGMPGTARLVSGETVEGHLRYVASEADPATRTFRIELEVPNADGRFAAGVSAVLRIPLPPVPAHRVSSALLALDDLGRIGIKAVGEEDVVRFFPAAIVRAEADAVWLSGLPERVRLITVGQGFVKDGETVDPVPEDSIGAAVPQGKDARS